MMHIYKQGSSNGTIHLQCDVIESLLGLIKSYIWQKLVAEINMSGSSELMRGAPRGVLWISSEGQENSNQGYSGRCYCSVHRLLKATNDDYIPCVTPQSVVSFKVIYSANGKKLAMSQLRYKFNLNSIALNRWFQCRCQITKLYDDFNYRSQFRDLLSYAFSDTEMAPGDRLNIKMTSYQYRDSHVKDKTVLRQFYL